jgi:ribokinase
MEEQLNAIKVNAVDTTAAGDAFNGAFAVGLLLGKNPIESARFAIAAAALSVTRAGAQPSMPVLKEVEQLLG